MCEIAVSIFALTMAGLVGFVLAMLLMWGVFAVLNHFQG